ncbi:SprT-like domain-containing protein [bacterium]|nr:SprT-like domain-containing protein [bacterium]MBU1983496.1 SprT-like domain-containing protein [bacterium]
MTRIPAVLIAEQIELFPVEILRPEPVPTPETSRARHQPAGDVYDLGNFFEVINRTVFKGALEPCVLRWSRNRWSQTLAICDVKKRVITVNRALDDARIPEMVIASIVHHEMLHLYFGVSEGPHGRQRYHTPQFRVAERRFPGFAESEKWLADHWPLRGRPAKRRRPEERSFLSYLALMYS